MPPRLTQVTRKKFYGRSAVAAALRTMVGELDAAIKEAEKAPQNNPLTAMLLRIKKAADDAVEADKVYMLDRKLISKTLLKLQQDTADALAKVMEVPVLVDEKTIAKRNRLVKKGGGK